MTDHNPTHTHYNDNADEASSLLTIITASPAPSSSLRQDGVATTKKNHGVPMRLMIATTCFVLGTLAVLYYDGSDSTNSSNTINLGAALLDDVYDPSSDFCFKDNENADKYCWYPKDDYPVGHWEGFTCAGGHGCEYCGPKCTEVYMYDPSKNFCYADAENVGKYCWHSTHHYPIGMNWYGVTGAGYDNCGPECTRTCSAYGKRCRE